MYNKSTEYSAHINISHGEAGYVCFSLMSRMGTIFLVHGTSAHQLCLCWFICTVSTDEGARQTPWAPAQFLLSEEAWLSATGHCVSYHRFTTKQGIEVP